MSAGPLVHVAYFKKACDQLLEPYLRLFGFNWVTMKHGEEEAISHAVYTNDEVLLDFCYWAEDFPNYCVMVGIGFTDGHLVLTRSQIGLWCAIPPDKQEQTNFRNEAELVSVLTQIRDEILPTYAKPLWEDHQLLRQLITRFHSENDAKIELAETERKRREAELAFKAGNFKESIKIYSELSPIDLTDTDRKRFEVAKKKAK